MKKCASHGYRGMESVLHTLAEMLDWFDTYVKSGDTGPEVTGTQETGRTHDRNPQ